MSRDRYVPLAPYGLRFGYGTNGFADHRLDDALALLADLGYDGVALTLDHHHLDPFDAHLGRRVAHVWQRLDSLGLSVVVETGARYLLDSRRKHRPTLLCDDGRQRRIDLLQRAVRIGADLGAEAVSFWSGAKPQGLSDGSAWTRLVDGCSRVLDEANRHGVAVGFEPEPGMFVDTLDGFDALRAALGSPGRFGLTLDVGHCLCLEPEPPDACVRRVADVLVNVQIEDMCRGVHEHLPFGQGELDVPSVLRAFTDVGYAGLVSVELPRHSHAAPALAARSLDVLHQAMTREEARA